jgi:hypothetical protein
MSKANNRRINFKAEIDPETGRFHLLQSAQSNRKDTTPKTHWQIGSAHYNERRKYRIRFSLHSLPCCLPLAFVVWWWYHF